MTRNAILGLGLLALIILAILCVWTHAGSIWTAQAGTPPLVDLTADAGTIVVRGMLPDDTTRIRFVNHAREVFGADRVTDRIRVSDTVEAPVWMDEVLGVLPLLGRGVNKARLRVFGDTLTLKEKWSRIRHKTHPPECGCDDESVLVVKDQLVVVTRAAGLARVQVGLDAETEGEDLSNLRAARPVSTTRGLPSRSSHPIIKSVKDASVEISGHTDPTGGEALTRELSQARAQSVLEYCVSKGVPRERLRAVGYGSKKPVASNATPWGRLANRRIEFHVL